MDESYEDWNLREKKAIKESVDYKELNQRADKIIASLKQTIALKEKEFRQNAAIREVTQSELTKTKIPCKHSAWSNAKWIDAKKTESMIDAYGVKKDIYSNKHIYTSEPKTEVKSRKMLIEFRNGNASIYEDKSK